MLSSEDDIRANPISSEVILSLRSGSKLLPAIFKGKKSTREKAETYAIRQRI
jgi:hypothetical protein